MRIYIHSLLLATAVALCPLFATAQANPGSDQVRLVCGDAGLGKHSNIAKQLRNSLKGAAATAGIGDAAIRVTKVTDISRPEKTVARAALNAGNIPVQFTASPLSFSFGTAPITVESALDEPCSVEREFTLRIKPKNGAAVEGKVRVRSSGRYKKAGN